MEILVRIIYIYITRRICATDKSIYTATVYILHMTIISYTNSETVAYNFGDDSRKSPFRVWNIHDNTCVVYLYIIIYIYILLHRGVGPQTCRVSNCTRVYNIIYSR